MGEGRGCRRDISRSQSPESRESCRQGPQGQPVAVEDSEGLGLDPTGLSGDGIQEFGS